MDWNKVSVDGEQPKGDLLRVEAKIDHIIKLLQRVPKEEPEDDEVAWGEVMHEETTQS